MNDLVINNDPKSFIRHTLNYMLNNEGNLTLKTNLLTAAFRYPLPLNMISPIYKLLHEKSPWILLTAIKLYIRVFLAKLELIML